MKEKSWEELADPPKHAIQVRQNKGFTLVELLVVLAVLSILALLLFPLVGRLTEASASAACVANLRTLGRALHQYIADNNGYFPPSRARLGPNANNPDQALAQDHWIYSPYFAGKGSSEPNFRPTAILGGRKPTSDLLSLPGATYRDAGIFWCPADRDPQRRPLPFASQSYAVNGRNIGGESAFPYNAVTGEWKEQGYKPSHALLAAVARPSQIIFAMDHEAPGNTTRQGFLTEASWPFPAGSSKQGPANPNSAQVSFHRHNGKAHALFLDGSVRGLVFEDLAGTQDKFLDPSLQ